MNYNTLIIIVWIGKWPEYLHFFMQSLHLNPGINLLLVSDQEKCPYYSDNVLFIHLKKHQIGGLFSEKLGLEITISNSRKLCDFKPAYGEIFEDYLNGYEYWGYCDLDLVWGDLSRHLQILYKKDPDVISFYRDFMSGPLCIYRNSEKVKSLFRKISGYSKILQDPLHVAMDENNKNETGYLDSASLPSRLLYLLINVYRLVSGQKTIAELRYGYQWYLKKRNLLNHFPQDMTEAVHREVKSGNITASFQDILHSDRNYHRAGKTNWKLKWQNGKLNDTNSGREIPVFHFIEMKENMKNTLTFPENKSFTIDKNGFHK